MRERPILFSGPMVRALLDGRKTQTRRVMKQAVGPSLSVGIDDETAVAELSWLYGDGPGHEVHERIQKVPCPYGAPGDRLWVRETCRAEELPDGLDGVRYSADRAFVAIPGSAADRWIGLNAYRGQKGAVVPAIHMPRWASRITLEVTGVRLERLQRITEEDAEAEGTAPAWIDADDNETVHAAAKPTYRQGFARLWRDINGAESWSANPWVWVVEFKVITATGEKA